MIFKPNRQMTTPFRSRSRAAGSPVKVSEPARGDLYLEPPCEGWRRMQPCSGDSPGRSGAHRDGSGRRAASSAL